MALGVPGVRQIKEYKRYYPSSDLVAQVIGMVNIDGHGQEGWNWASKTGWPSRRVREVLINPRGSVVKNIRVVRQPQPSKDVALSIDLRLQFIAYRACRRRWRSSAPSPGRPCWSIPRPARSWR